MTNAHETRDASPCTAMSRTASGPSLTSSSATSVSVRTSAPAARSTVGGRMVVDLWAGIADRRTGRRSSTTPPPSSSRARRASWRSAPTSSSRRAGWTWTRRSRATGRSSRRPARSAITVRQAMAHRAGLSYLDRTSPSTKSIAWDPVIRRHRGSGPAPRPDRWARLPRRSRSAGCSARSSAGSPGCRRARTSGRARRSAGPRHLDRPAGDERGPGRLDGAAASRRRLGVRQGVRAPRRRARISCAP